jgi:hypothetical protein
MLAFCTHSIAHNCYMLSSEYYHNNVGTVSTTNFSNDTILEKKLVEDLRLELKKKDDELLKL